jgi:hypothetical protein
MFYRVFNQGEIPSLAHGWRSVIVLTPGRKWLTVIDWTTLETARMQISGWQNLRPHDAGHLNRRKVRAVIRHRLKYATRTRAINQALTQLRDVAT